jgi:hypothetical protein
MIKCELKRIKTDKKKRVKFSLATWMMKLSSIQDLATQRITKKGHFQ